MSLNGLEDKALVAEWTLVVKNYQHQIQLACKMRRGVKGEPILPALLCHSLFHDRETLLDCSLSVHPPHPDSPSEPSIWESAVYIFHIKTEQCSILNSCLLLSDKERKTKRMTVHSSRGRQPCWCTVWGCTVAHVVAVWKLNTYQALKGEFHVVALVQPECVQFTPATTCSNLRYLMHDILVHAYF